MARLTEAEKAANKITRAEREKAFRARRRAYEAAMLAARATFHAQTSLLQVAEKARMEEEAAFNELDSRRKELRRKIVDLEAEIAALPDVLQLSELKEARNSAYSEYHSQRRAVEKEVADQFSDVAHTSSAVAWTPPV